MIENIRLSFRGILSHKMRSFLTMLGIIIGIAAIIAIVSTIQGTNEQIQKNLIGSGVNNVRISLNQGDWEYDYSGGIPDGIVPVTDEQLADLRKIRHAENVSLYHQRQDYDGVYHAATSLSGGYVMGIDTSYLDAAGLQIRNGRGISSEDLLHFRKVCLLDTDSSNSLFQGEDPLNQTIEIRGEPFVIVGTVGDKESFQPLIKTMSDYYTYSGEKSGKVYIPSTCWPVLYQYDEPEYVVIRADKTENMTAIGKDAESILNQNISGDYTYKAQNLMEQAKQIQQLSQSTNTMLIWIAAISLLVGGIGVMNIMLVSVTERTSEIGLKKAIGAPKKAILIQFLTEAVVLTSLGGILGVITGIILAYLISNLNGTPVAISVPASVFAVAFSMAIGIVFGILPSYKAANLDPIEALRRE